MRTAVVACWLLLGACDNEDQGTEDTPVVDIELDAVTRDARPTKRSEIRTAVHEGTNSMLIFGGQDGPIVNQIPSARFLNDTWIYEPGAGWIEVDSAENPRRRARYAMAVDQEGNRALMFGGRFRREGEGGDYTLFNDLWQFDFLTREWTQLSDGSSPDSPAPRYYGQGAWDASSETFYVWGGNLNTSALNFQVTGELWAWHDGSWEQLQTTGQVPSDRSFLDTAHDTARNHLVMFGGQLGNLEDLAFNDTYALNLDTQEWTRLHNGRRSEAPSTRMHAPIEYDEARDRYVLFGGHTDVGDQNDIWSFNPDTGEWTLEYEADVFRELGPGENRFGCIDNDTEVPADYVTMDLAAPERRHNGLVALMYDSIWVALGIHAECSDYLDDVWRYDLGSQSWSELIEADNGESCLRADDDCVCLCL